MAIITATSGNDVLEGTVGVDDTASFVNAGGVGVDTGVIVNLSSGEAFDRTNFDIDTLISIENVTGSAFDDLLIGDPGANVLDGGAGIDLLDGGEGNDTLIGGPGNDTLIGGDGTDTVSYASASAGVVVDLADGVATNDGDGGADMLGGIENVTGSAFDDSLTGDGFANVLNGGAGNDTLVGGAGNDTLIGGDGNDVFKYSFDLTQGDGVTFRFTDFFYAHGGAVEGGEVAGGTKQGQFSSLYTQWLESLGLTVLDLGQNSPDGMPVVEGPDGTFGERESFMATTGKTSHERFYSDSFSTGEGKDTVASTDGFDTIVGFDFAEDKLEFDGLGSLNLTEFASLFNVSVVDADKDGTVDDTKLALLDNSWSVSLLDDNGVHVLSDFHDNIFS